MPSPKPTGTEPFNGNDAPGNDSSATNTVVRTNDLIVYHLSASAAVDTVESPTVSFSLPRGTEMTALPAYCRAGSSLTPASAAPSVASTASATSLQGAFNSLSVQNVTCVLDSITPGSAFNYDFTVRVRPEATNGTVLTLGGVTVSSPSTASQTTESVSATVSSASKWDVSINGAEPDSAENTAFIKQGTVQRCDIPSIPRNADGSNQWCYVGGYPVTVSVPDGGKGGVPMAGGSLRITIPTDPVSIWGQEAVDAAAARGVVLPGAYLGANQDSPYGTPNSRIAGNTTAINSVRSSGTVTLTQGGTTKAQQTSPALAHPGEPIIISVNNADTTAYTCPTDAGGGSPANTKLRTDRCFVFSQRLFFEVPLTDLMTLDNLAGLDKSQTEGVITAPITFTANESALSFTGLDSKPNSHADADTTRNNYRTVPVNISSSLAASNFWVSPNSYSTATPATVYSNGYPI